jgi:hypothetical protein
LRVKVVNITVSSSNIVQVKINEGVDFIFISSLFSNIINVDIDFNAKQCWGDAKLEFLIGILIYKNWIEKNFFVGLNW